MGPSLIGDEVFVTDNLIGMYLEIDNDNDLMGYFLNLPHLTFDSNPLSMIKIHNHEQQSQSLHCKSLQPTIQFNFPKYSHTQYQRFSNNNNLWAQYQNNQCYGKCVYTPIINTKDSKMVPCDIGPLRSRPLVQHNKLVSIVSSTIVKYFVCD